MLFAYMKNSQIGKKRVKIDQISVNIGSTWKIFHIFSFYIRRVGLSQNNISRYCPFFVFLLWPYIFIFIHFSPIPLLFFGCSYSLFFWVLLSSLFMECNCRRPDEMEFLNGIISRGFWAGINSSLLRLEFFSGFLPSFFTFMNRMSFLVLGIFCKDF